MERVQPKIQAGGRFTYPEAEEILDVPQEDVREILESLARDGILRKEFFDKILTCPECRSRNLKFSLVCPECGSPNTVKKEVLEHLSCGMTEPREEFEGGRENSRVRNAGRNWRQSGSIIPESESSTCVASAESSSMNPSKNGGARIVPLRSLRPVPKR